VAICHWKNIAVQVLGAKVVSRMLLPCGEFGD
jgi:hypothetical protein